jgi:hypothetical protein
MSAAVAHDGEHPAAVAYETPPAALAAAERHGPYHLVRHPGGIRITGLYRTVWGAWRRALRLCAIVGLGMLILGAAIDGLSGRTIVIDLTRSPPRFSGSPPSLLGLVLLAAAIAGWLTVGAFTWRQLHRLEIDASPDELIVRHVLPSGEQLGGRWKSRDVELIVAEEFQLSVQPRGALPVAFTVGGPWTSSVWLVEQIGKAGGIQTATSIGSE